MKNYDTRKFTRSELYKYLSRLGVSADISLGLLSDFGVKIDVDDPFFDDAYEINVKDKKGYIAGTNERSILFGVYRLLTEWGVTFVRPGKYGTVYPEVCRTKDVLVSEKAARRHRTMCIEGAVSIENVLDMIEWLPKVGFNSYYIQFSVPHVFFDRWYSHMRNPYKQAEPHDEVKTVEYMEIMTEEIKKRGLLLHTMGHGWTCSPFGISDKGWYAEESFPKEYENICALVNGERKVWNNIGLYTQLCYSNPYVRSTMVKAVIDYVHEHPYADVVHFWLGDYFNNTCECPECTKGTYSDHYVKMVNDITDTLAKEGLKTKVMFLLGYNTSHPPVLTEVKNQENTMFLFAPICRNYHSSFPSEYRLKEIPEYKINSFSHTECNSVDKNLAYLHAWKKKYGGDCVDFDYHLMWDHILDAGGEGIARIINTDLKNIGGLGMNGFISCQLQRNTFPTSIAMTAMAKTLWDDKAEFEDIRRTLYSASFGEDAVDMLCEYFSALSDAFDIGVLRCQKKYHKDEHRGKVERAIALMESFGTEIEKRGNLKDECQRKSWEYLEHHRKAYIPVGKQILARLDYNKELAEQYANEACEYILKNEDAVQSVVDTMYFDRMIKTKVTVVDESEFEGV